ncbi:MAG: aspartate-semialdehyde dehydrogenase [Gammaproteobacteria bacterium]|nr:aspartate-semialdehyde dehydrogenase [Gammaproteobacteria bacterium]
MKESYNVAIVGATGIVGTTALSILEERNFPIKNIYLLASSRSVGETRNFKGQTLKIEELSQFDFAQTDICFFCVSNEISAEYAPKAAALGNVVIDKSSHFRYQSDIPLIVPEVNESEISAFKNHRIIANPNCNTIPIAVALKPIYDAVGIARMNVATYQSVSGTGKEAVAELAEQSVQVLDESPVTTHVYPQQIAFNVLPHIDQFEKNGYTREEMKIVWEMQKIFNDYTIAINPTTVRVPVFCGHSAAVHIETNNKITAAQALKLLKAAPGVKVITGTFPYPTPVKDAAGKDDVFVGRIREDLSHPLGLNLWIVADNLRKGAALNAIQVAEKLIGSYL